MAAQRTLVGPRPSCQGGVRPLLDPARAGSERGGEGGEEKKKEKEGEKGKGKGGEKKRRGFLARAAANAFCL